MKSNTIHYDGVDITIETPTIGIYMSGGADSTLLYYMLAKQIVDQGLNTKIIVATVRRPRPWNPAYAERVFNHINKKLDFRRGTLLKYYPEIGTEELDEYANGSYFHDVNDILFNEKHIMCLYSGITANPPPGEIEVSTEPKREVTEEPKPTYFGKPHRAFRNPFINIDKKWVAKQYAHFDITDDVFPLTRSCEGTDAESYNYLKHCGTCWWCQERMWAFGRYE